MFVFCFRCGTAGPVIDRNEKICPTGVECCVFNNIRCIFGDILCENEFYYYVNDIFDDCLMKIFITIPGSGDGTYTNGVLSKFRSINRTNYEADFNLDRGNYNDLRETAIDTAKSLECIRTVLNNQQVSGNLENGINNAINYIDNEGGRNSEEKIVVIQFGNPDDGDCWMVH